jgi:phytoene dehydrogenase-like protein
MGARAGGPSNVEKGGRITASRPLLEPALVWALNAVPRSLRDASLARLSRRARHDVVAPEATSAAWSRHDVAPTGDRRDVVVVGGGVGGCAAGALLARAGHRVTLIEARRGVGGRACAGSSSGFHYDMGVHLCGQGAVGPAAEVAQEVGADLRWYDEAMTYRLCCGPVSREFGRDFKDLGELAALARVAGARVSTAALRALGGMMFARTPADVGALDGMSLRAYLDRLTDDPAVVQLMEVLCLLMLCVPADVASAGEFVWCFSRLARAGRISYPVGGVQRIPESFAEAARAHGGTVITGCPVDRIVVDEGRARGVVAGGRRFEADWVISNVGIKKTLALAGEGAFPDEYRARVGALRESFSAVTIKYGLACPVLPVQAVLAYAPVPLVSDCFRAPGPVCPMVFVVAPPDPVHAPPGQQLLIAGALHPAKSLAGAGEQRAREQLHQRVCQLVPGLEEHLVHRVDTGPDTITGISGRATADAVGVAQRFDQVGAARPDVTTPVQGLFLVGCDAGGRGVGVEQASDSALNLARRLGAARNLKSGI